MLHLKSNEKIQHYKYLKRRRGPHIDECAPAILSSWRNGSQCISTLKRLSSDKYYMLVTF